MEERHRQRIEELLGDDMSTLAAICSTMRLSLEHWPRVRWLRVWAENVAAYRRIRALEARGVSREIAIGRAAAEIGLTASALKARIHRDDTRRKKVAKRNAAPPVDSVACR